MNNMINMSRKLREQYKGAIYHIMAKGNQGDFIFDKDSNKIYFLKCLETGSQKFNSDVFAFCIMGNHYHLLARTNEENLSSLMHYIGSSYASRLRKQDRIGHIFSGRYKSIPVESEQHILFISRYIHLNPKRAGMVDHPGEYPWSSYRPYMWDQHDMEWLNEGFVLDRFGSSTAISRKKYEAFMEDPRTTGHHYPKYPESIPLAKAIFGGDRYSWAVLSKKNGTVGLEQPLAENGREYFALRELYKHTCGNFRLNDLMESEARPEVTNHACLLFIYIAREYLMSTNDEIGQMLQGTKPSTISHRYKRALKLLGGKDLEAARIRKDLDAIVETIWP
jgi:REP element-mobilizing transposase RayT